MNLETLARSLYQGLHALTKELKVLAYTSFDSQDLNKGGNIIRSVFK